MNARDALVSAKRIVVKAGTNVVMQDDGGLALSRLYGLIESVARLRHAGREVLVVSSGAVGLGTMRLGLPARPKTLAAKQAAAAVGQGRLMALYADAFEKLGLVAAQVLLTEEDFTTRERYLNLSATLEELFRLGVVPILNENDTVSTVELKPQEGRSPAFGDNDRLSALVASKTNADLLVLLTDVDGLFTESPRKSSAARLVPLVPRLTPELLDGAEGTGARGRGGMRSKLLAAEIATKGGALAVIANGRTHGVLDRLFAGEELGTLFLPRPGMSSKKRWIAWASGVAGRLVVNAGAATALRERGASLLPAGVVEVVGSFGIGDVVALVDEAGRELGRGIVKRTAEEAARLAGHRTDGPGKKNREALVMRDDIVLAE